MGRAAATLLLAVAALIPAAVAAPASAAADIEPGTPVWVGPTVGYPGTHITPVYIPVPADTSNPGTPDYWAYCIEQRITVRSNTSAVVGDLSSYLGSNFFISPAVQAKVHWVISHAYPAVSLADLATASGATDLTLNDAIEGAQYAIWRYTDLGFDANWAWETPASEAVYRYLVNGANADTNQTPPTTADIDVSVTGPATAGVAGTLVGPFTVSTNQPTARVSADPAHTITDASGAPVDVNAVVDGQQLYLDLRGATAAGTATITATVDGADGTGMIVSTPVVGSTTPTAEAHRQSQILVAAANATTSASAAGSWTAAAAPAIGTTLTDASDEDHVLSWRGGQLIDSVSYTGLVSGAEYTITGELMRKSDGSATGITGSTTFTAAASEGVVEVAFTVPAGFAGQSLVAFETLYAGDTAEGTVVAEHKDIADVNQTVSVAAAPAIGTTLVDGADRDKQLAWNGGSAVDTISYTGLTPGAQYTVSGELMRKSDGKATGITATATFTATSGSGSVDVVFTVPAGYAGLTLVAFESLFEGASATGEPVAVHRDLADAAQTISVATQPAVTTAPSSTGGLAATGAELPACLTGVAVTALILGALALLRRRRTAEQA